MDFRTVIEPIKSDIRLTHDRPVLMLGSCFTDEVGGCLVADGFEVVSNPFGALYNPVSIANCIHRCASRQYYNDSDLTAGPRGWHCLDYAMRFSGPDIGSLLGELNGIVDTVNGMLQRNPVVIVTLGSAYTYRHKVLDRIVGNCHKFPATEFEHRRMAVEEVKPVLSSICHELLSLGISDVLFTVSPIRHLAYGLQGNSLSKATLRLAVEAVCNNFTGVEYFPSYEILMDDLRDYRFYARDMKHPSEVAVDYIYGIFCDTYMSRECRDEALLCRKQYKASQHRQIL